MQGKIYGNPKYIGDNFPETDKFIHCKVERLNTDNEKEGEIGVNILRKEDHVTDEENFQKAREVRMNSPFKQLSSQVGGGQALVYGGGVLGMVLLVLLAMKNRKKVASKSN